MIDKETVKIRVQSIVAKLGNSNEDFDIEVDGDTDLSDVGFDSLSYTELAFEIEDEFNIEVTDEEIGRVHTTNEVVDLVISKIN